MTQEFRSTVYSLFLPVSWPHRNSSLWPQWTSVRACFSWCQDMKVQGMKSLKWQCLDSQALASSALSPALQSKAKWRALTYAPLLSKFSKGRKKKRQWQMSRMEEKWNLNKLNSSLNRKVQLKKKGGEKCKILIWTIAPCLMLLAKERREKQKKSESEGRCHGEFQWDEFLINSKEHDTTWI